MKPTDPSAPPQRRSGARFTVYAPLIVAAGLGLFSGVGAYTFSYAKGLSYFSTDPKACVNCHIMEPQYDGWQKSSHHAVAVCVDCHLPQAFVPKYLAKAENGWRHGEKFTTQDFHEPIYLQEQGQRILQDNCERCHGPLVNDMLGSERPGMSDHPAFVGLKQTPEMLCTHCHSSVGHGPTTGLGGPLRADEHTASPTASSPATGTPHP